MICIFLFVCKQLFYHTYSPVFIFRIVILVFRIFSFIYWSLQISTTLPKIYFLPSYLRSNTLELPLHLPLGIVPMNFYYENITIIYIFMGFLSKTWWLWLLLYTWSGKNTFYRDNFSDQLWFDNRQKGFVIIFCVALHNLK